MVRTNNRACIECTKAKQNAYRAANRERILILEKAYREKNKEKILAKARIANRKWRAANPGKLYAAVKAWNERNPEKIAEYRKRKYQQKKLDRLDKGKNPK